ncbi:MAG TPA: hypothetical protein VK586_20960, partial [Streptosporangiaceae bacterium]|nr:hypothetical protein [Streptosporangiaceae bacterium]
TAMRLTRRPGRATVAAALIGVAVTWLGILLAYDSFTWPPGHDGWPVSFFVVALTLAAYVLAQLAGRRPAGRSFAGRGSGGRGSGGRGSGGRAFAGREPAVPPPGPAQPAELGRARAAEFRMER